MLKLNLSYFRNISDTQKWVFNRNYVIVSVFAFAQNTALFFDVYSFYL